MNNCKKKWLRPEHILFVAPFMVWLYCFRGFYTRKLVLIIDAVNYFFEIQHYLNHMVRGVYPMWNPFNLWGTPCTLRLRMFGEFNPFLWINSVWDHLGFSVAFSYSVYILVYFFIGMIGFFLLARRILSDKSLSLLSVTLLMFTNLGSNLFNDYGSILIIVPAIWFFYFLVAFVQTGHVVFFLGITFSTMLILTTYLPFFFLTVFLIFLLLYILFFFRQSMSVMRKTLAFVRTHRLITFFCIGAVTFAFLPGLLWYLSTAQGGGVTTFRSSGMQGAAHAAALSLKEINLGGIIGSHTVTGIFSNTHTINLGVTYVPVFTFIVFVLGAIAPITRKLLMLFCLAFLVFFISLGDALPLHAWLYHHVFFFRMFRNLHFLTWMSVGIFILFVTEQLCMFLKLPVDTIKQKTGILLYVLMAHAAFFGYLFLYCDYVLLSSFVVVGLSAVFFMLYFLNVLLKGPLVLISCLLVLAVIQPIETFHYLHKNTRVFSFPYLKDPYTHDDYNPKFSFTRPMKNEQKNVKGPQDVTQEVDTSGFDEGFFVRTREAVFLKNHVDHDVLKQYVRNKFVVYDQVEVFNENSMDIALLEDAFTHNRNVAFIAPYKDPLSSQPAEAKEPDISSNSISQVITENSEEFTVLDFDLNRIVFKTNFKTRKFIVYNDSYYKGWHALINGKATKIMRANIAFKGLWVPSGENVVSLQYGSRARHAFNLFLVVFFQGFFVYLLYRFIKYGISKRTIEKAV